MSLSAAIMMNAEPGKVGASPLAVEAGAFVGAAELPVGPVLAARPTRTEAGGAAVSSGSRPEPARAAAPDVIILCEASRGEIDVVEAAIGASVYGDRDCPLAGLPPELAGGRLIRTNDRGPDDAATPVRSDRYSTLQSGYVSFQADADGFAYVAYDARALNLPDWLVTGWVDTGAVVTALEAARSTAPAQAFRLHGKAIGAGEIVDIGGADRAASGAPISNLFVFVDDDDLGVGTGGGGGGGGTPVPLTSAGDLIRLAGRASVAPPAGGGQAGDQRRRQRRAFSADHQRRRPRGRPEPNRHHLRSPPAGRAARAAAPSGGTALSAPSPFQLAIEIPNGF